MSERRSPLWDILGERLKRAGAEVVADINESTADVLLGHVEDAVSKLHEGVSRMRERRSRHRRGYDR